MICDNGACQKALDDQERFDKHAYTLPNGDMFKLCPECLERIGKFKHRLDAIRFVEEITHYNVNDYVEALKVNNTPWPLLSKDAIDVLNRVPSRYRLKLYPFGKGWYQDDGYEDHPFEIYRIHPNFSFNKFDIYEVIIEDDVYYYICGGVQFRVFGKHGMRSKLYKDVLVDNDWVSEASKSDNITAIRFTHSNENLFFPHMPHPVDRKVIPELKELQDPYGEWNDTYGKNMGELYRV